MARGRASNQKNNTGTRLSKNFNQKITDNSPLQNACQNLLGDIAEINTREVVANDIPKNVKHIMNKMATIVEMHQKKFKDVMQQEPNPIIPKYFPDRKTKSIIPDRIKKCNLLLENLKQRYPDLNKTLNHVKIVEEFKGIGLKKSFTGPENESFIADKERNLIEIPKEAIFDSDTAVNHPALENFCRSDKMVSRMNNVRLAIRLAFHAFDKNSKFRDWINTLPDGYDLPLFWSDNDFENLAKGGESVYEELSKGFNLFINIARQYLYLVTVFSGIPALKKFTGAFTFDAYKWSVATVLTRANGLVPETTSDQLVLGFVPVIEFCNTGLNSKLSISKILKQTNNPNDMQQLKSIALDISEVENHSNIHFSYTGQAQKFRAATESLINNGIFFDQLTEIDLNLPQNKPLHQSKTDYMITVGGVDYASADGILSPRVIIAKNDPEEEKKNKLELLINFMTVALAPVPEDLQKNYTSKILAEAERVRKHEEKKIQKKMAENRQGYDDVNQAKKEGKKYEPKPEKSRETLLKEKAEEAAEQLKFEKEAIAPPKAEDFPYKFDDLSVRPKSLQFLKIRVAVLNNYVKKIDVAAFDSELLKSYVVGKQELFEQVLNLANSLS